MLLKESFGRNCRMRICARERIRSRYDQDNGIGLIRQDGFDSFRKTKARSIAPGLAV
jgi:hypothetical protein